MEVAVRPRPVRVRVAVAAASEAPAAVPASEMLPGKPYRYPATPDSYYERSQLTVAGFVKALRAEPKARDSRDEFMLMEASRLQAGIVLTRVTRWRNLEDPTKRTERRDYLLVEGTTLFFELVPPQGYAPREPNRFDLPKENADAAATEAV